METILNYPKEKFIKELKKYINDGQDLIEKYNSFEITNIQFKGLERDYNFWEKEVSEFLKIRFDDIFGDNEYLKSFKNVDSAQTIRNLTIALSKKSVLALSSRHQLFIENLQEKVDVLELLLRKVKFIPVNEFVEDFPIKNSIMKEDKIFISHSSFDSKYVEKIIDLLEIIGVPSGKIFCSSFEGYGVQLGNDFLEYIKKELNNQVFVIFILSDNFYSSTISLCEMGATWVKTNKHLPILIPPFDYKDIKGVIPTTHGMKINEKEKYNSLKDTIEELLEIKPINNSVWERKRDNILRDIKKLLDISDKAFNNINSTDSNQKQEFKNDDFYSDSDNLIKEQSKKEWQNDFEMQLDYIQRHKKAIEKLKNHMPIDIDLEDFKIIRQKGREEWPINFEMQLDYEQRQVESLRRLNKL